MIIDVVDLWYKSKAIAWMRERESAQVRRKKRKTKTDRRVWDRELTVQLDYKYNSYSISLFYSLFYLVTLAREKVFLLTFEIVSVWKWLANNWSLNLCIVILLMVNVKALWLMWTTFESVCWNNDHFQAFQTIYRLMICANFEDTACWLLTLSALQWGCVAGQR